MTDGTTDHIPDDIPDGTPVEAAGCLLRRPGPPGTGALLALVHRPKYDDISFPKGKLEPGEDHRTAALREVLEETGFSCRLGRELPSTHYLTADQRPKRVRYWVAEVTGGVFTPNREVDRMLWLPPDAARTALSHHRDRLLIDALLAGPPAADASPNESF